ncbi:MAG TPA: glycosyl hydrolase [Bacteroides sp.]|nr:glycosyl hydrolase [Bacteroides sp.]
MGKLTRLTERSIIVSLMLLAALTLSCSRDKQVYLFSYFVNNGEDGLHLAYSEDGLQWEALNDNRPFLAPSVGESKLMRDPCIVQGPDGKFHMVWTAGWWEKGIGYAWSEDLIHWSEQQFIPVMAHEPEAKNCWAPEIFYDPGKDLFMVFWSTTIPGRFPETDTIDPNGLNHRMYYVTTKDFESFSETELFYDRGFNVIDGTLHLDNGTYILFLKDETPSPVEKNIRIATGSNLTGGYSKPSEPITGDYWAEGPTAMKIDGTWIVYFDKYREDRIGAVRSSDLKNWEDISGQVSFPAGTNHGTVFKAPVKVVERIKSTGSP